MSHSCRCYTRFYSTKEVLEQIKDDTVWKRASVHMPHWQILSKFNVLLRYVDYYAEIDNHVLFVGNYNGELTYYDYNISADEIARVYGNERVATIYALAQKRCL